MKRRDTLKTILLGGVGAVGLTTAVTSCKTDGKSATNATSKYGRIKTELDRDKALVDQGPFFSSDEKELLDTLCNLILPPIANAGGAVEAGVPEFIDFIMRDMPQKQLAMRGGLMWVNAESNKRYRTSFVKITKEQQTSILDDIAYPSTEKTKPYDAGRKFFSELRWLTTTGYYTSEMGIQDLGYVGNRANIWEGVPEEVLQKHNLAYDINIAYVDQSKREVKAEWDQDGKLLT